jgi:hypothetical protein
MHTVCVCGGGGGGAACNTKNNGAIVAGTLMLEKTSFSDFVKLDLFF